MATMTNPQTGQVEYLGKVGHTEHEHNWPAPNHEHFIYGQDCICGAHRQYGYKGWLNGREHFFSEWLVTIPGKSAQDMG